MPKKAPGANLPVLNDSLHERFSNFTREAQGCYVLPWSEVRVIPPREDGSISNEPPPEPEFHVGDLTQFFDLLTGDQYRLRTGVVVPVYHAEEDDTKSFVETVREDGLVIKENPIVRHESGSAFLVFKLASSRVWKALTRDLDESEGGKIFLPGYMLCLQTAERIFKLVIPLDLRFVSRTNAEGVKSPALFLPPDLHLRVWRWVRAALLRALPEDAKLILNDYQLDHTLPLHHVAGFKRLSVHCGGCLEAHRIIDAGIETCRLTIQECFREFF